MHERALGDMKLQSRCPHCHQIEPMGVDIDTQASHECPSCGLRYVPLRHLFVADDLTQVSIAVRDDPVPPPPKGRAVPEPMSAEELAASLAKVAALAQQRQRRWRFAALTLALLLAVQIALHHRHLWAARYPWLAPVLSVLCQPLRCRIQAPEVLSAVSVVSSGFDQLENGDFVLGLHLRHDLAHPVATPAIELTLTDAQERAVLRKVLLPENIGLATALAPGNGLETETRFELDPELHGHVSGFRVELFYP